MVWGVVRCGVRSGTVRLVPHMTCSNQPPFHASALTIYINAAQQVIQVQLPLLKPVLHICIDLGEAVIDPCLDVLVCSERCLQNCWAWWWHPQCRQ